MCFCLQICYLFILLTFSLDVSKWWKGNTTASVLQYFIDIEYVGVTDTVHIDFDTMEQSLLTAEKSERKNLYVCKR